MLQDVQERLVYRTYIYIRTDILQYAAAPGDLAYPEKLEMMEVDFSLLLFYLLCHWLLNFLLDQFQQIKKKLLFIYSLSF
jgi:hypothetical protein